MNSPLRAVDFFCGGGGMSLGMTRAGIDVVAALDNDPLCRETYIENHPNPEFILSDITKTPVSILTERAAVARNDDAMLFIGCSPCQYWSIVNGWRDSDRKAKSRESKNLLRDFIKFVDYYRPGFVTVENVRGIEKHPADSGLAELQDFFTQNGYVYKSRVVVMSDYSVPQTRRRFVLIASRMLGEITLPPHSSDSPLTVADCIGKESNLPKINAGEVAANDPMHRAASLSDINLHRLRLTGEGDGRENWRTLDELQINAYRGKPADFFRENYGRMSWNKPAPTITTRFYSLSCGRFGHPEQDRAISLREGAMLQTFPKKYKFKTINFATTGRLIGNAVPPKFAEHLGRTIVSQAQEVLDFSLTSPRAKLRCPLIRTIATPCI